MPPFLRQIGANRPALTLAPLGLRIVRAFLPIATLYVGKLIIDEAVRLVGKGTGFENLLRAWQSGQLDALAGLLALEFAFALAIGSDLLGRRLEASGTHAELIAQGDRYAGLFELQAAGYR